MARHGGVSSKCNILIPLLHVLAAKSDCISAREGVDKPAFCVEPEFSDNEKIRQLLSTLPHAAELSGKLQIHTQVSWVMWSEVKFRSGFASGTMSVRHAWEKNVSDYFAHQDVVDLPHITNYMGSVSSIVKQPTLSISNRNGQEIYQHHRLYMGDFKQSFDPTCYPFDRQTVRFEVSIYLPAGMYFELQLACGKGLLPKDAAGNPMSSSPAAHLPKDVHSCTQELHYETVGFIWDNFVCTRTSDITIECVASAQRSSIRILSNFFVPSVLVSMMSFASFMLPKTTHATPRIATTMIAMLTQISLSGALKTTLPESGPTSWLERYLLGASVFMFINLICHVTVMRLIALNYEIMTDLVDDVACGVTGCLFMVIPPFLLVNDNCIDGGWLPGVCVLIAVFAFLMLWAVIARAVIVRAHLVRRYQEHSRKCQEQSHNSTDSKSTTTTL